MSRPLRSVFFGTPAFALPSLEATRKNTDILCVVTQPDRPKGRGQKLAPCEVKERALSHSLQVFSPPSLRKASEELSALEKLLTENPPDLFVVTAYGNILPESFLAKPRLGSINVHGSLLPRWRGAAPIQRALEAGDAITGVCLQKMVFELDAGDVLAETKYPLNGTESSGDLFVALAEDGGRLLDSYLKTLSMSQKMEGLPQNPSLVTFAKKITKDEGYWTPAWSARETHNKILAFTPWPSVWVGLEDGSSFKVLKSQLLPQTTAPAPGFIEIHKDRVLLGCEVRTGEEALSLESIQIPGKGAIPAIDFFRNHFTKLAASGQTRVRAVKIQQ